MVENSGREAPTLEPDNARQEGGPALRVDSTSVVRSPSILNALQVLTDTIIKARKESPWMMTLSEFQVDESASQTVRLELWHIVFDCPSLSENLRSRDMNQAFVKDGRRSMWGVWALQWIHSAPVGDWSGVYLGAGKMSWLARPKSFHDASDNCHNILASQSLGPFNCFG